MAKEKEGTFRFGDIPKRSFCFFQEMRSRSELCDVTFHLGSESFSAHRIIVAAVIPHFRSLLRNKEDTVVISHIEPNAFKLLLQYVYSCEIEIDTENVKGLLSAACYLGVSEVREACCDFIENNLNPENVLTTRLFADDLNYSELFESTHCYIKENFTAVSHAKDFYKLPLAYLKDLVDEDDLNVKNEKEVLSAVMKWVNECPEERSSILPELLLKIRMHLIEPLYLTEIVKTEKLIHTSTQCRDLLDEAKNYNLFPQLRSGGCSFRTQPRQSVRSNSTDEENRCIYLLCAKVEYSVQRCDPLGGKWLTERSAEIYVSSGSTAEVKKQIYFFDMGHTMKYHFPSKSYKPLGTMPTPRYCAGATSFQNKIYICGGKQPESASDAVECFDPEQNKWEIMSSMPKACWGLSAVALGQYIYILGGKDECFVYDHMLRYNPIRKKWRIMPSMLSKRCYAGAAVLNDRIYVCGGATDLNLTVRTSSAEAYDPFKNAWEYISPMSYSPCQIFLLSCSGKLHALSHQMKEGGYINLSEVYDPEKDEWSPGLETYSKFGISGAVVM